jgi:hypothetical protein
VSFFRHGFDSPESRDTPTNKDTNKLAGYQQSGRTATQTKMQFRPLVIEENERWRMRADARLVPLDELEASDWIPFRKVLAGSKAQLMIGHVTLTSVDPDRAAAHSKRVVDGVVGKKWNYRGVVMTDDLVMGAICRFRRGAVLPHLYLRRCGVGRGKACWATVRCA